MSFTFVIFPLIGYFFNLNQFLTNIFLRYIVQNIQIFKVFSNSLWKDLYVIVNLNNITGHDIKL